MRGTRTRERHHGLAMPLERLAADGIKTSHRAPRTLSPGQAPTAYAMSEHGTDGCVRAVVRPRSPRAP
ncbi:hypothetical protein ACH5A7_14935 [Streptomyces sp. NPDC018955]|uniref:hypothetical protein n=1 Tax=Streptomyces sp. NPDC018955 TaxID=3365055 RepID=UPI0037A94F2D